MSLLKQVKKGPQIRPHFISLYGVGGVGKSTFGASAPNPIFLGTDDGIATMDVASFPVPKTWQDVKASIQDLLMENHEFETLVIDTINGLEPLLSAHICKEAKVQSIEDVDGGFGKGYVRMEEEWVEFFKTLKRLRMKMHVILLGHAKVKTIEDPYENERFDRYLLKMHERGAALVHESVDCNFFANFRTVSSKEKGARKAKMRGDGTRRIFTEERPAFLAKSRFDLPFEMDLSWDAFIAGVAECVLKASSDELAKLFKGRENDAIAYLVNIGWLLEGQTLKDLLAAKRKPILSRKAEFLKAVEEFASKQTEPETVETEASE